MDVALITGASRGIGRATALALAEDGFRVALLARSAAGLRETRELVEKRGGTAVDIGANQGFFAFALSALADRVVCFEPNPDYAFFARWMLRGRAEVYELALEYDRRPELYFNLGQVQAELGDQLSAVRNFTTACLYDPEYFDVISKEQPEVRNAVRAYLQANTPQ